VRFRELLEFVAEGRRATQAVMVPGSAEASEKAAAIG
jgi:hypothetical protein